MATLERNKEIRVVLAKRAVLKELLEILREKKQKPKTYRGKYSRINPTKCIHVGMLLPCNSNECLVHESGASLLMLDS